MVKTRSGGCVAGRRFRSRKRRLTSGARLLPTARFIRQRLLPCRFNGRTRLNRTGGGGGGDGGDDGSGGGGGGGSDLTPAWLVFVVGVLLLVQLPQTLGLLDERFLVVITQHSAIISNR